MTKIKPLKDYVLIEPLPKETTTSFGLIIPDTGKETPQQGKILAVGPKNMGDKDSSTKEAVILKVDDIVIYKKWSGNEVKVDNKDLLLVKEEDILAILEK